MSMDFSGRESDKPVTDQEGVMFAAQPVWDRNRKRKGFGGRKTASAEPVTAVVTPEPRTFAAERDYDEPMALDQPIERPVERPVTRPIVTPSAPLSTSNTLAADRLGNDENAGLVAPIGVGRSTRTTSTRSAKSSSAAPAAIAAGVVALGALAAGGWYMSRDTSGIPELAAGQAAPATAAAPLTPVDPPAQMAMNTPAPPPVSPVAAETPRASAPVRSTARARPAAAAPSAGESGVNASTTAALPDGPQPYSATAGVAPTAPTPASPPLITLPPAANAAPAAVPVTPPALPQEPAAETPQTVTPQ